MGPWLYEPDRAVTQAGLLGALTAATLGMPTYTATDLAGGQTIAESAALFLQVLDNNGTPAQRDVVTANAALAIQCADPALSLPDALEVARESLVSGRARGAFRQLLNV